MAGDVLEEVSEGLSVLGEGDAELLLSDKVTTTREDVERGQDLVLIVGISETGDHEVGEVGEVDTSLSITVLLDDEVETFFTDGLTEGRETGLSS